jgi:hypothetical protein
MTCHATAARVWDRLQGDSTAAADRALEAHLAECSACRDEAESIAALWSEMQWIGAEEVPSERLAARFRAALESRTERHAADVGRGGRAVAVGLPWRRSLGSCLQATAERLRTATERAGPRLAAAVALLAVGLAIGRWLPSPADREIAALRREVHAIDAALLGHQSASERLRGVELARRLPPDAQVLNELLDSMRRDPSLNVRLAAVDALRERLDRPVVGAELAAALGAEPSPLMQITLARVLLEGEVEGGVAAVDRLLERTDLDPSVRDYLRTLLREVGRAAPPRSRSL